jgi:hypothetical protein
MGASSLPQPLLVSHARSGPCFCWTHDRHRRCQSRLAPAALAKPSRSDRFLIVIKSQFAPLAPASGRGLFFFSLAPALPLAQISESNMITKELLRAIRNDLPMKLTIVRLGRHGPIAKHSDGYFRFQCPRCGELRATVNPRNNLAHCFQLWREFQQHRPDDASGPRLLTGRGHPEKLARGVPARPRA